MTGTTKLVLLTMKQSLLTTNNRKLLLVQVPQIFRSLLKAAKSSIIQGPPTNNSSLLRMCTLLYACVFCVCSCSNKIVINVQNIFDHQLFFKKRR